MEQEQVPHVRPWQQNVIAVASHSDAPVKSHNTTGNGKRTQPKWQNVDRHVESCTQFKSIEIRAHLYPRETFGVEIFDGRRNLEMFGNVRTVKFIIDVNGWIFGTRRRQTSFNYLRPLQSSIYEIMQLRIIFILKGLHSMIDCSGFVDNVQLCTHKTFLKDL